MRECGRERVRLALSASLRRSPPVMRRSLPAAIRCNRLRFNLATAAPRSPLHVTLLVRAMSSSASSPRILMDPFCLKQFTQEATGQHIAIPCHPDEFVKVTNEFYDKNGEVSERRRQTRSSTSEQPRDESHSFCLLSVVASLR